MKAIKAKCASLAQSKKFTIFIVTLILINAVLVGLETYPYFINNYSNWLYIADTILLWIFTIEIFIRFLGSKNAKAYFKDPWNIFDFVIVLSSHVLVGAHYVTVLRVLRVLRVMRAISVIPSLRKMVNALLLTIPSMGTIMLLLAIFFYIYAVIGTMLFSHVSPEHFGSMHETLISLFQFLTMDSWASSVMRPMLDDAPMAWIYFISFILIGGFVIINLFVGVIVNNVEQAAKEDEPTTEQLKLEEIQAELRELKRMLEKKEGV